MKSVKDYSKEEEQIWFRGLISKESQKAFLQWAKNEGCKFEDRKIDPLNDRCGFHMAIDKNLKVYYVGAHSYFLGVNRPKIVEFNAKEAL